MGTRLVSTYGAAVIDNSNYSMVAFTPNNGYNAAFAKSSTVVTSGKILCEVELSGVNGLWTGIGVTDNSVTPANTYLGGSSVYTYYPNGQKSYNGTVASYGEAYGALDIIGVLIDMDAKKISFSKNGVWQGVAYTFSNITNAVLVVGGRGGTYYCSFGITRFLYPMYTYSSFDLEATTYEYTREYSTDILSPTESISVASVGIPMEELRNGIRIKNIMASDVLIANCETRSTKTSSGFCGSTFIGNKVLRSSIGYEAKINYGQRSSIKQSADTYYGLAGNRLYKQFTGKLFENLVFGERISNRIGKLLTPVFDDSNAIDHVKLIVMPTNTYFGSGITVDAQNNLYDYGKYRLRMNNAIVIPFLDDFEPINQISFPIDVSLLSVGSTHCRLEYLFLNGNEEYIDFTITKEANNRQAAATTLYWYSGGFDIFGDTQYITSDEFKSVILATKRSKTTAVLEND